MLLLALLFFLILLYLRPALNITIVSPAIVTTSSLVTLPFSFFFFLVLIFSLMTSLILRRERDSQRLWEFISFLLFALVFFLALGLILQGQTEPGEPLANEMGLIAFLRSILFAVGISLLLLAAIANLGLLPLALRDGLLRLFDNFGGYGSRFLAVSFLWGMLSAVIAAAGVLSVILQQELINLLRLHTLALQFGTTHSLAEFVQHNSIIGNRYSFQFLNSLIITEYYKALLIVSSISIFLLIQAVMAALSLGYVFFEPAQNAADSSVNAYRSFPRLLVSF
ncbi:MAG: hypothetical protein KC496_02440, partial [Anaerolineae bacterium]|nr:hypothetical protein [Anaerolineae bacterium]